MTKYIFEIQSCIEVEADGETAEEARIQVIDNLKQYAAEMVTSSCYVSDGREI